jgi:Zn-dependent peptidase ImmA (M78 family)
MTDLGKALRMSSGELAGLSAKTSISVARLQELSQGADPSMREVRALSNALKLSIQDFAPPPKEADRAGVLFREIAKRKRVPADALVEALSRKMGYSLELLKDAPTSVPWWTKEFATLPKDNPEKFAWHFRQLFRGGDQVSPLSSLPTLLVERLQVVLHVINTPHLEGASAYIKGTPFMFVATRFPARMLFTCAHELGHVLAHHDAAADFAMIDSAADLDNHHSRSGTERFAHAFASALLIPLAGLGIVLKKVRESAGSPSESPIGDVELLYVARIFGVSFEVAARRCEDADLLPRGSAVSLNEKLKEEYGSAEKRADMLNLPPRVPISFPPMPQRLLASVVEHIRAGDLSIGRASMMLGLSIGDLLAANANKTQ